MRTAQDAAGHVRYDRVVSPRAPLRDRYDLRTLAILGVATFVLAALATFAWQKARDGGGASPASGQGQEPTAAPSATATPSRTVTPSPTTAPSPTPTPTPEKKKNPLERAWAGIREDTSALNDALPNLRAPGWLCDRGLCEGVGTEELVAGSAWTCEQLMKVDWDYVRGLGEGNPLRDAFVGMDNTCHVLSLVDGSPAASAVAGEMLRDEARRLLESAKPW